MVPRGNEAKLLSEAGLVGAFSSPRPPTCKGERSTGTGAWGRGDAALAAQPCQQHTGAGEGTLQTSRGSTAELPSFECPTGQSPPANRHQSTLANAKSAPGPFVQETDLPIAERYKAGWSPPDLVPSDSCSPSEKKKEGGLRSTAFLVRSSCVFLKSFVWCGSSVHLVAQDAW